MNAITHYWALKYTTSVSLFQEKSCYTYDSSEFLQKKKKSGYLLSLCITWLDFNVITHL